MRRLSEMTASVGVGLAARAQDPTQAHAGAVLELKRAEALEGAERIKAMRLRDSELPTRFQAATFDGYRADTEAQRKALQACHAFAAAFADALATGRCLVLVGGVGTGKTHLAAATIRAVIDGCTVKADIGGSGDGPRYTRMEPPRCLYTTAARMLREIRDTYRRDSAVSETQALARFVKPELLVVDELGVQRGTDDEKLMLFEVLDQRYGMLRPSLLVSNLTVPELTGYVGERVLDRLQEGGSVVVFDWLSYRRAARG